MSRLSPSSTKKINKFTIKNSVATMKSLTDKEAMRLQDYLNQKSWDLAVAFLKDKMDGRELFGFTQELGKPENFDRDGPRYSDNQGEKIKKIAEKLISQWFNGTNSDGAYVPTDANDPALTTAVTSNPYQALADWFQKPTPLTGPDVIGFKQVAGALATTLSFVDDAEVQQTGRQLATYVADISYSTTDEDTEKIIQEAKLLFEKTIVPNYKALNKAPETPIEKAKKASSTKDDFMALKGFIEDNDFKILKAFFANGDTVAARVHARRLLNKY